MMKCQVNGCRRKATFSYALTLNWARGNKLLFTEVLVCKPHGDAHEKTTGRKLPIIEKPKKQERKPCCIGNYCEEHRFVHGAEAEELRRELEELAELDAEEIDHAEVIQCILDKVDARDSLAFLEASDGSVRRRGKKAAKKKVSKKR